MPSAKDHARRSAVLARKRLPSISEETRLTIAAHGDDLCGEAEQRLHADMAAVYVALARRREAEVMLSGGHPQELD